MTQITTRAIKGATLTYSELDTNFKRGSQAKIANYTFVEADNRDLIEFNGASLIATLPVAATILGAADTGDFEITIKNLHTSALTITRSSTDTIDGATSISLIQYESIQLKANASGNGWNLIGGKTLSSANISGGSISSAAISGGSISSAAISGGSISSAAISGGSISDVTLDATSIKKNGATIFKDRCHVYNNANQSVANNTWVALAWNSEYTDTNNLHDPTTNNDRITVPTGAVRAVFRAKVGFLPNSAGYRQIMLSLNGGFGEIRFNDTAYGSSFGPASTQIHTPEIPVTPGHFYSILAFQNSGAALDIYADSWFSAEFFYV